MIVIATTNSTTAQRIRMGTLPKAIVLLIIVILSIIPVSALCQVEFVTFAGSCPEGGDLRVVDEKGTVLIEQFYTVNRGCYDGKYAVAVPGGSGNECRIKGGDKILFQVNGITMGNVLWSGQSGAEKVVILDLVRPTYAEAKGEIISPALLYFVLTVMVLLVVIISIVQFYRRRT